ncbi:MAG TPA: efflux RND transporter periplasmic adaptor subunit [Thermoanaerobaculia bacterium]|nr:efflux RND transporter periplasmic adaptor subunit [Thermoanaerobaculia bacterium]
MKTRTVKNLLIIALLPAAVLATACSRASDPAATAPAGSKAEGITITAAQKARIHTVNLEPTEYRRTVETTGTVAFDADQSTQVVAPISGPVARLLVDVGARVRRGQPMAEVASPDFAADVSAYRKGSADAANARRIADLDKKLFANGGLSRRELEQAETDATAAEADRDAALEALRSLGVDQKTLDDLVAGKAVGRNYALLRSPLAGTVVERMITPGQLLQAGSTTCFTVANLSKMWVMANVFTRDLADVKVGDPADVITETAPQPVPGKVSYIAAVVDPQTRAVAVRIVADNPGGALKKDLYVKVRIHSSTEHRGLLAPVSAVLRDDENLPFVYLARNGNNYFRRRIDLGSRVGDSFEVLSGLTPEDKVVVEGGLFLKFAENQ